MKREEILKFRVNKIEMAQIKKWADKKGITLSEFLRAIVSNWIEKRGKK
jgi:hypothetical protein